MKHFLRTLGVEDEATWIDIREGYKQQIKVWHPDRFIDDEKLHAKAEEKTKEIHYALRRLDELKCDIGESLKLDKPFLAQYAELTNGGNGAHGKATFEDRRMGYVAESFGNWAAVGNSLSDSIHRGAKVVRAAMSAPPLPRRRRATTIQKRPKRMVHVPASGTYFLIGFGLTLVFSTIGAYNLLQLFPEERVEQKRALSQAAERELLQMLLSEPVPSSEKDLGAREKLELASKRSLEARPPMINAAMQCKIKSVEKLIRQGENINVADSLGQTPLIWAAKRNCPQVAALLLQRKANPDLRSANGFTAHRWAEWYRNVETSKVLEKYNIKR